MQVLLHRYRAADHVKQVVVHSATSQSMNFLEKNFAYDKLPFGEFLDKVESGEKLYLRALSSNKPADKVTNLAEDFPSISHDFDLPPQMMYAKDHLHSSPLRISGPVTMWLHYDVSSYTPTNNDGRLDISHRVCKNAYLGAALQHTNDTTNHAGTR